MTFIYWAFLWNFGSPKFSLNLGATAFRSYIAVSNTAKDDPDSPDYYNPQLNPNNIFFEQCDMDHLRHTTIFKATWSRGGQNKRSEQLNTVLYRTLLQVGHPFSRVVLVHGSLSNLRITVDLCSVEDGTRKQGRLLQEDRVTCRKNHQSWKLTKDKGCNG